MKESIKRINALTNRNIKEIIRDPLSLIFFFAVPILMLLMFYYLFHQQTPQFEVIFFAPAMIVFGHTFITLFGGMLIATDRSSNFLIRLYTTPTKSYEFILGYIFALLPIGIIQSIVIVLVTLIIDISFITTSLIWLILLSVISILLFIMFGILIGSICNEKSVGGVASIIIMAQSIFSGMWFTLEGLDELFIKMLEILPFRNATMLMQNTLFSDGELLKPSLILISYTLFIMILSICVYQKKMKVK